MSSESELLKTVFYLQTDDGGPTQIDKYFVVFSAENNSSIFGEKVKVYFLVLKIAFVINFIQLWLFSTVLHFYDHSSSCTTTLYSLFILVM